MNNNQETDNLIDASDDKKRPDYLAFAYELQELAGKAQQGDKQSYKLFLLKISPHIRRYVRKQWWGDHDYQEDLVQDTMIAIHTHLHTYDPERPILPWIKTIVTYKIADFSRKFSRWNQNEVGSEDIETFSESSTNSDYKSIETRDFVSKAIDSLPSNYAQIVRMLKVQGFSIQEVSDKTGISVAAVKTYAHRAYKKMLEFKENNQDEDR